MRTRLSHERIRNVSAILAVAFVSFQHGVRSDVIYEKDDRQNYSQVKSEVWKKRSLSVPAMVYTNRLVSESDTTYSIHGPNYKKEHNLCKGERFAKEPIVANCSGTLIAPDVVLTAGHCLGSRDQCKNISFVFGMNDTTIVDSGSVVVKKANVYECQDVLRFSPVRNDVAVLRLKRKVEGRDPLKYRNSGEIAVHAPTAIIGNAGYLPTKISLGGRVRSVSKNTFIAEVDSCTGSSGSPVFDRSTGEVEGIIVGGEDDWVKDAQLGCRRSKVCKPGECSGEEVVKISKALGEVRL